MLFLSLSFFLYNTSKVVTIGFFWPFSRIFCPFSLLYLSDLLCACSFERLLQTVLVRHALNRVGASRVSRTRNRKPFFVCSQITMSTYQLAVVLLFNDVIDLTLADVTASTHLKDADLVKNVKSLLDSKILKLRSPDTEVGIFAVLSCHFEMRVSADNNDDHKEK